MSEQNRKNAAEHAPIVFSIVLAAIGMGVMVYGIVSGGQALIPDYANRYTICGGLLMACGAAILLYRFYEERKISEGENATVNAAFQKRHVKVPAEGYVKAKIIGITQNLHMAGERDSFVVLCRYTEPGTGIEETYSSDPVPEYPGKEIIGKTVRVYLDRKDPESYRVDLRSLEQ
ncbi:MAG: hypothetical protein ACI4DT_05115 [Chordicoccus sp.]